jgi:hypothetical protein
MILIKTKKQDVIMSLTEFARWACLIEAYEFINNKADELGIDSETIMKPSAIEKYIDERFHAMLYDVQCEYNAGNI